MNLTNIELGSQCKNNTLHNPIHMTLIIGKNNMILEGRIVVTLGREQRL